MDIRNNHVIRIISTVVLSFFLWTFGGFYELAYALKTHQKPSPTAHLSKKKISKKEFHRVINDIEKILTKTDTGTHRDTIKKLRVKSKRLQSIDKKIRK